MRTIIFAVLTVIAKALEESGLAEPIPAIGKFLTWALAALTVIFLRLGVAKGPGAIVKPR